MSYTAFIKLYKNYLFVPIYFLIGLFFQIDKIFNDNIDKIYNDNDNDNENESEEKKLCNFLMINNPNDFYKLEKNF